MFTGPKLSIKKSIAELKKKNYKTININSFNYTFMTHPLCCLDSDFKAQTNII